jgi:transcriptional regulator with PAS, ATPase and Fis domain
MGNRHNPGRGRKRGKPKKRSAGEAALAGLEMYGLIFDSMYKGYLVTDAEGYINHFNKPYGEFLGLNPELQIGKHCTEMVEDTPMHLVAQTGKPEIHRSRRIMGKDMVVQRIPKNKRSPNATPWSQPTIKRSVRPDARHSQDSSLQEDP